MVSQESLNSPYDIIQCSNFSFQVLGTNTICWPLEGNCDILALDNWNGLVEHGAVISCSTSFYAPLEYESSNKFRYFSFDSSKFMAEAVLEIVKYANWQRVAIVTDAADSFYLHTVEHCYFNFKSDFILNFMQIFILIGF